MKETFHDRVIPAITFPAHRTDNAVARKELENSGNRSKFIRDSIEYYVCQHRLVAEKLDDLLQVAAKNSEMLSRLLKAPLPPPGPDTPYPAVEKEQEQVEKELFNGLQAFDDDENGERA